MSKGMKRGLEVGFSLLLAIVILFWMYRGFPFSKVGQTLSHEMDWGWMLLSLSFGIIPQILRGIRWRMALTPLDEHPTHRHCISAIYMSFAASLVIPRVGEISRCATLTKTDGTPFSKSLGTVVTERIIDSLLVLVILAITFVSALPAFLRFFKGIGFDPQKFFSTFTVGGITVTLLCLAALAIGVFLVYRWLKVGHRFKTVLHDFGQGIASIRKVKNPWLYMSYTVLIWFCYFLHFYLAFFAFGFTCHLGFEAGILAFCMITVAVLVPTPNGAGPWHFAVKIVLMQFGISAANAILFALIVHALQTLLVIILGVYGYITILFTRRKTKIQNNKS